MKLRNYTNAFIRIESGAHVLACDIWMYPVWDGGWKPVPITASVQEALHGVTHVFISHLHEDHCDLTAMAWLPRSTVIIAPDIYPNHLIRLRLSAMGFTQIVLIKPGEPYSIRSDFTIEAIMPMNRYAQEEELYNDEEVPTTGIDAGAIITDSDARVVLLSDNSPYNLADAGVSLERMQNADLLAFPFNGFADDYPICYDNFSREEKRDIARIRNEKRVRIMVPNLRKLKPKYLLPYSSDFIVCGPRALEFADLQPAEFFDRGGAAKLYEAATGIPNLAAYEDDIIVISDGQLAMTEGRARRRLPAASDLASANASTIPNTRYMFPQPESLAQLGERVVAAAANMFAQMTGRRLKSEWILQIELQDAAGTSYILDLRDKVLLDAIPAGRKLLHCFLEANYLNAIITGRCSWNGAQGSYNLTWRRQPTEYDFPLYRALHFLTVPRAGSTAAKPKAAE